MKNYRLETLYLEDGYLVRRSQYKNTLYIYVYKKVLLNYNVIVSVKVIAVD
jgi:hypothetical protein